MQLDKVIKEDSWKEDYLKQRTNYVHMWGISPYLYGQIPLLMAPPNGVETCDLWLNVCPMYFNSLIHPFKLSAPCLCFFFSFCTFDSKAENFCLQGAGIVKEVLEEAREIAMKEHNFEFATNMWVAESFTNQVTEQFIKPSRP